MMSLVGALAALWLGAAEPAPSRLVFARIQLSTGQPRVVLGVTSSVDVVARVVDEAGAPVEAEAPPDLLCSTGRAGRFVRVDAGVYRATWLPPPERHPHVAMLLAVGHARAQRVAGFLPVPLWGRGQLRVDTKPLSTVTLVLGETQVGPVQADRRGLAVLDVESPPGPTRATAESVDRAGNESRKPVDLGVPPFNRLAAFAPWPARAGEAGTVLVVAASARGTPRAEPGFTLQAAGEDIPEARMVPLATGLWAVDVPVPTTPGARVPVAVHLRDVQSVGNAELVVVAGPPAHAVMSPSGPAAQRVVSAVLTDAAGNPAPLEGVVLQVRGGPALPSRASAPGTLVASAPAASQKATMVDVVVNARVLASVELSAAPAPSSSPVVSGPGTLEVGPPTRAGLPWPQRAVAVTVRVPHADGTGHAPGPLDVTAVDGVQVLARRDTPTHAVLVLLPAPVLARDRIGIVIQSADGATTGVAIPTVALPVLERWAVVQGRVRLHAGGLLLAGPGVDAGFSWPVPLDTAPYRLALRFGAGAAAELAAPLTPRVPPFGLSRVAWGAPVMGFAGVEGGYGPWRVYADGGLGAWALQVRVKAAAQSPVSLLGVGSLLGAGTPAALGGVAPLVGARVGGAARWRFVQAGAEALVDAGWLHGTGVSGPAGGLTLSAHVGLVF